MNAPLQAAALDQLFLEARTHRAWDGVPVSDLELHLLYDLVKLGPTSSNTTPGRYVFVRSPEGKARLLPCMAKGNVEQTRLAPVTVIVAYDTRFYEHLPRLSPGSDRMKASLEADAAKADRLAFQGSSLEGAYLIVAARALGIDAGPMGGFDSAKLDAEFFPDGRCKSNFLINLGHGLKDQLRPRAERLTFDEACQLV